jgi:hypothetical protein
MGFLHCLIGWTGLYLLKEAPGLGVRDVPADLAWS